MNEWIVNKFSSRKALYRIAHRLFGFVLKIEAR